LLEVVTAKLLGCRGKEGLGYQIGGTTQENDVPFRLVRWAELLGVCECTPEGIQYAVALQGYDLKPFFLDAATGMGS
jgi:hypothetical protein